MAATGEKLTAARAYAIGREYLPDATDADIGFLLWNETGWPCFFDGDPEDCLRLQFAKVRVKARLEELEIEQEFN